MDRSAIYRSALLLGLAAAAPAAAQEPVGAGFCAELETIVSDAGNDFAAFRGAQIGAASRDSGGYTKIEYAALKALSGAARCTVEDYVTPEGRTLKSYGCEWTPVGSKVDTVKAIAIATRECVGGDPMDYMNRHESEDWASARIYDAQFEISIGAGTAPQVFFTIRAEH